LEGKAEGVEKVRFGSRRRLLKRVVEVAGERGTSGRSFPRGDEKCSYVRVKESERK